MQKTLENISEKLQKNAISYASKFGKDISNIPEEKIFDCYVSKYYNIRECEKHLFGDSAIRQSGSTIKSQTPLENKNYPPAPISLRFSQHPSTPSQNTETKNDTSNSGGLALKLAEDARKNSARISELSRRSG
jgi:hypothetical protein